MRAQSRKWRKGLIPDSKPKWADLGLEPGTLIPCTVFPLLLNLKQKADLLVVILFLTNAGELFISLHSQNHGRMEQRKTGRLQAPHAAQGFCKAMGCLTIWHGFIFLALLCKSLFRSKEVTGREPWETRVAHSEWYFCPECAQLPGNLLLLCSLLS